MDALRHTAHGIFKSSVEFVTSTRSKTDVREGKLTPEEFVATGDYLVNRCSTWKWEAGDTKKAKPYLPVEKQYLVTRNVPCYKRAAAVEGYISRPEEIVEDEEGEGWVATENNERRQSETEAEIPSIGDHKEGPSTSVAANPDALEGDDADVPDIDALDIEDDEATLPSTTSYHKAEEPEDHVVRLRRYDIYVSYDKYYAVPRVWLVGYNEHSQPLTSNQMLEDLSEDHAKKTATVDPFPHANLSGVSIHPCKHASVMKKLGAMMQQNGKQLEVDFYMVLFLKFIAVVIPTIEYDFTMPAGL